MGNIDEKRLSVLLGRIDNIRAELEALENEVRGLGPASSESHETGSAVSLGSSVSEATVPAEASSAPIDETPIEIDIQDIDIPPIIEDTTAGPAAPVTSAGSETEAAEAAGLTAAETTEASEPATVSTAPATGIAQFTGSAEATASAETLEPAETDGTAEAVTPTEALGNQPEDDLPFDDDFPTPEPKPEPKPKAAILDSKKAETAVMDVMADNQAWRTDRPGSQVKNVISAISLNDRVLLINVLFKEDPMLFQSTISAFNAMATLDEAVDYILANFPDWNLNSEPVYRLMMAVRRKLR